MNYSTFAREVRIRLKANKTDIDIDHRAVSPFLRGLYARLTEQEADRDEMKRQAHSFVEGFLAGKCYAGYQSREVISGMGRLAASVASSKRR